MQAAAAAESRSWLGIIAVDSGSDCPAELKRQVPQHMLWSLMPVQTWRQMFWQRWSQVSIWTLGPEDSALLLHGSKAAIVSALSNAIVLPGPCRCNEMLYVYLKREQPTFGGPSAGDQCRGLQQFDCSLPSSMLTWPLPSHILFGQW